MCIRCVSWPIQKPHRKKAVVLQDMLWVGHGRPVFKSVTAHSVECIPQCQGSVFRLLGHNSSLNRIKIKDIASLGCRYATHGICHLGFLLQKGCKVNFHRYSATQFAVAYMLCYLAIAFTKALEWEILTTWLLNVPSLEMQGCGAYSY